MKKAVPFSINDQNSAWVSGSIASTPNSACGRSQPMAIGPSARNCAEYTASGPNEGRNSA